MPAGETEQIYKYQEFEINVKSVGGGSLNTQL